MKTKRKRATSNKPKKMTVKFFINKVVMPLLSVEIIELMTPHELVLQPSRYQLRHFQHTCTKQSNTDQ